MACVAHSTPARAPQRDVRVNERLSKCLVGMCVCEQETNETLLQDLS